jgi:cellulose synthase/poly-beta-1,6-N-acetylglucosamine synthase-like glycosyltransferase
MTFLYAIAIAAIVAQIMFMDHVFCNYMYVIRKFNKNRNVCRLKTAVIVPCKGIDTAFEKNISSFYELDYSNYEIIFVTESSEDPAYSNLLAIKDKCKGRTKAFNARVLVAGVTSEGSQKLHNLLYACENAEKDTEIFAFADSDACVRSSWLGELTYALRNDNIGVVSGYRWFIPMKNNLATIALSVINAKVAQLLGATRFNQAWGGSMAVRVDIFKRLGMDKIWQKAISDDLTLSRMVKKSGLKVTFVPACFVASYEQINWPSFFEFARRQFLITRVTSPGVWWFGLLSCLYSILGLWGFAGVALYLWSKNNDKWYFFLIVSLLFLAAQFLRGIFRQNMISRIFPADWPKIKVAAIVDIIGNPLWSWLMFFCILSSSFGRIIKWRGVRYKLTSPTEAVRL